MPVVGTTTTTTNTYYDLQGRDTLQVMTGGSGTRTVLNHYDAAGNLLTIRQWASTDPNGIGAVTHTFAYDAAGRQTSDSLSGSDAPVPSTYDEAGNLIAGGRTLFGRTTLYDALNRPYQVNGGYYNSSFTYDANGNLQTASNPFSRVSRLYDQAGAITTDSLLIATQGAQPNTINDLTQHVYVFNYGYDASGRRTTQEDPIGLAGGMNLYGFAGGDPVNFSDPFGLWPTKTHNSIINQALGGRASAADVAAIRAGSAGFDHDPRTQTNGNAFMHGMKNPLESSERAAELTLDFISERMSGAIAAQKGGNHAGAMKLLSQAMHTVMDMTSPAHRDTNGNPKNWNAFFFVGHGGDESGAPTQAQQAQMNAQLREMYRQVTAAGKTP